MNMSKKSTKTEKAAKTPKAPKAKNPDEPRKMTALDAAYAVLEAAGEPMTAPDIYAKMVEKKLWESPNGLTPAATIYAAMIRDIGTRGKDSRFRRPEASKFAAAKV
jgi:hypothetical protein